LCGLLLLIITAGESFIHFNKNKNAGYKEKETDMKIINITMKKQLNQHFSKVILVTFLSTSKVLFHPLPSHPTPSYSIMASTKPICFSYLAIGQ
jgi:hypothetical protein